MNKANNTVVSSDMMKSLRAAGLDGGYEPVPEELEETVHNLLNGKHIADMDADTRRKLLNYRKRMRRNGVPGY